MTITTAPACAGQTWVCDLIRDDDPHASNPATVLGIMAKELTEEAKKKGVGNGAHLEFWANDNPGGRALRGLFMGDTSGLAEQGWVLIARLF